MSRHPTLAMLAAAAALAAATGCEPAGNPFSATPRVLDFEGVTGVREVTFRNETAVEIEVNSSAVAETTGYQIVADGCKHVIIAPTRTCVVRIRLDQDMGGDGRFLIEVDPNIVGEVTLIH